MDRVLKSKAEKFYDNFVDRLLTDYLQSNPRAEHAIKFASRWLFNGSCKEVLDLGCGIGWSSNEFASSLPKSRVVGLDLSPSLIDAAKDLFGSSNSPVFSVTDITSSEFQPEGKFDGIVMLDLYEHISIKDRFEFQTSVQKCLKNEFVIVLTCPSPSFQEFLRANHPELLQPVDEDVLKEDMKLFAEQLGAKLLVFQPVSIWRENDYNHILISNKCNIPDLIDGNVRALESRDSKIRRIARTKFRSKLRGFGSVTWAKAKFPFLISLAKIYHSIISR